jgi:hypothetical protein
MISLAEIISYWKIGFKPVPLDEFSKSPTITWGGIYDKPDFWSIERFKEYAKKFHNLATTFGQSQLVDSQGRQLYLYCLDVDSEEVLKRLLKSLEEWKLKTFVTKTQKDYGYHVYWFEYNSENVPIKIEACKKGFEFEIKCAKSLCTLPPSRHRDNPFFHYENVGQSDKIMISDGLYGKLVDELLVTCFKRKKISKSKEHNLPNEKNIEARGALPDATSNYSPLTSHKTILTTNQIEESVQVLLRYYKRKTRHSFALGLSGFCYKEHIDKESANTILTSLCKETNDQEVDSRLETLRRTYVNGRKNGSDNITGKSKLREIIMLVSNCDEESAEQVIQQLLVIWSKKDQTEGPKNNKTQESQIRKELLDAGINKPTENVIMVVKKTVKLDDSLVRGVFYTGCSTWTLDPINLGVIAPTSEGKTYTVLQTLQSFPRGDVKYIGSMSPKVIIRQDSILVDADTLKPVQTDIDALKKQIKKQKDDKQRYELEEKLRKILENARPLIDLRGKIYVFLEPPHPETWIIIKPIMSHDNFVMEHPYVEVNTLQGIHVRNIITLGFPAFVFCTAKDESKWEHWDEIASRSLVMSPNMSGKKYRAANILNAHQLGLPTAMQESLIRSRKEIELAEKCVSYLKGTITNAVNFQYISEKDFQYNNPVWIPYHEILGATLPANKGTEMRINRRLMLLLRVIALTKSDSRYQIVFNQQTLTIAAVEDLSEALYITQNSTGLPPYKVKFFNDVFYALCREKLEEKLKEYHAQNNVVVEVNEKSSGINKVATPIPEPPAISSVRITANELSDFYNQLSPRSTKNSDNIRKTYLNELTQAGFIETLDVREGNTKKVYYPIVSPAEEVVKDVNLTQETAENNITPEFFTCHKIEVPKYFIPFSKDWLSIEVWKLWKCGIDINNDHYLHSSTISTIDDDNYNCTDRAACTSIQFLDLEDAYDNTSKANYRKKLTIVEFMQKYNHSAVGLSRLFSRPIISNSSNEIFGDVRYLGVTPGISALNSRNQGKS